MDELMERKYFVIEMSNLRGHDFQLQMQVPKHVQAC